MAIRVARGLTGGSTLSDVGVTQERAEVSNTGKIGLAILGVMCVLAILGPAVVPYGALTTNAAAVYLSPSAAHWFGTDEFGRDVFSRCVTAARLDLSIAVAITVMAMVAGTVLGAVAGYVRGVVEGLIMRAMDLVLSFPAFVLAMVITATLGRTVPNVMAAVTIGYTPYFARLTRSEVIRVTGEEYCDAARCAGLPRWRVIGRHVLPNALTPALSQGLLCFGWSMLDVAGLSFLGLGIQPPTAEWGVMVSDGTNDVIGGVWWTSAFPGLFLLLAVLGVTLVSEEISRRRVVVGSR